MICKVFKYASLLLLIAAFGCVCANPKPESGSTAAELPSKGGNYLDLMKNYKPKEVPGNKKDSKAPAPSYKPAPAADTFETIIAPFLKTVTPHFYNQIIRREKTRSEVA